MAFGSVASPPNCSDLDRGRRAGTLADYRDFLKLVQYFNAISFTSGYPVEPVDVHPSVRHLDALRDMAILTDKPFHAYSLGAERILDGIEIARIARGISAEELDREPSLFTIVNTNSPLKLDTPDAARHHRDGPAQPDRLHHAVHAGRRDGAGDGCRRGRRAERRSARGACLHPNRPAGSAGDLWRLHVERRYEVGSAGLRHARVHEGGCCSADSSRDATAYHTGHPTPVRPMPSMRRQRTNQSSRCGA